VREAFNWGHDLTATVPTWSSSNSGNLAVFTALLYFGAYDDRTTICIVIRVASAVTYVTAMPMPSFCVSSNCNHWPSRGVLVFGFFGMASAYPTNFIWRGNPLLFSSWLWILLRERPPLPVAVRPLAWAAYSW